MTASALSTWFSFSIISAAVISTLPDSSRKIAIQLTYLSNLFSSFYSNLLRTHTALPENKPLPMDMRKLSTLDKRK
ncbi:hypothetical protein D3C71_1804640 [compost metagenome]